MERQVDHRNVKWLTLYLCCIKTDMAEILFPGTFFKMFWPSKFQLSIIFTFRVIILLVDESVISVKLSDFPGYHSITLKVQVIGSWNFECQNILFCHFYNKSVTYYLTFSPYLLLVFCSEMPAEHFLYSNFSSQHDQLYWIDKRTRDHAWQIDDIFSLLP